MSNAEIIDTSPRFFSWKGRLNRLPYLYQILGLQFLFYAFAAMTFVFPMTILDNEIILASILIPFLAAWIIFPTFPIVKRFHDLGWPGWYYVFFWVPLVGLVFSLLCFFKKGTTGPNSYGPDSLPPDKKVVTSALKFLIVGLAVFVVGSAVLFGAMGIFSPRWLEKPPEYVAKVGKATITAQDFQSSLGRYLEQYSSVNFEKQDMRNTLGSLVLTSMIRSELLIQEADRLGLEVSKKEIAEFIKTQPAFIRDGAFIGVDEYKRLLAYHGITPADYERQVKKELLMKKLESHLTRSINASDEEAKAFYIEQNDLVSIRCVLLTTQDFVDRVPVSEKVLEQYFQANGSKYRTTSGQEQSFTDVRAKVENDYRQSEAARLMRENAEILLKEARRLKDLSAAAREINLEVFSLDKLKHGWDHDERLGPCPDLAAAALVLEPDAVGGPVSCSMGLVVFQVIERIKPDLARFQADIAGARKQLLEDKKSKYMQSFEKQLFERIEKEKKIYINTEVYERIVGIKK